ncbi:unnamed protein product [Oikopleura dioica]|uniref:Uncharacterized protein n=1 Tax=Oikopleura dioica TaxID=34765 RepID=E4YCK6_OIKDI|nr:unnamed protein product [Oikopleura dioica]
MQNGQANSKHGEKHNKSMVRSLQTKQAAMSNNFKSTLEARRENMKAQSDRRASSPARVFLASVGRVSSPQWSRFEIRMQLAA